MSKKNKNIKSKVVSSKPTPKKLIEQTRSIWPWLIPILIITAISYLPMLSNELTNWDDEYYVVQNGLLRGPDWVGIFKTPVVSNYHPLTIITLAFNYAISGLDATSYLVLNLLLHLVNTALVFYFIWNISGKKHLVAAFVAIIFGIHPMHVESVAWISERKDVLYTLFFLVALIQYWQYLLTANKKKLYLTFLFFVLSILSKPAAIILPLVLFLLDYWKGRTFNQKVFTEKIVFFVVALLFAVITFRIQSKTAIAGLDFFPLWTRFFFATYVNMVYILRFFVPYPMAAFHPYPPPDNLGWPVLLSPLFMIALLVLVWFKRKNKLIVFSFFFFVINLLLVMQVVSIGATLVAERYTYVPYIGLAFLIGMLIDKHINLKNRSVIWGVAIAAIIVFCFMTFQRTKVWEDSNTLWSDTIKHYPDAPVPLTNRANHLTRLSTMPENKSQEKELLMQALEDCNVALRVKPNHVKGLENRQNINLRLKRDTQALADANSLIRLEPANKMGYYTKGVVYLNFRIPDSALKYFNKSLELDSLTDMALNNRGTLLFNVYQKYDQAIVDFTKAININPVGNYYMNRSKCYYRKGDLAKAQADARAAIQKGEPIEESYRRALNI